MSEHLDDHLFILVARMLDEYPEDALLIEKLWRDRRYLINAFEQIRIWDITHSEALSLERVQEIIEGALQAVSE